MRTPTTGVLVLLSIALLVASALAVGPEAAGGPSGLSRPASGAPSHAAAVPAPSSALPAGPPAGPDLAVAATLLLNYNTSEPGNFPYRASQWVVGPPAVDPADGWVWLPQQSGGDVATAPDFAPAVAYDPATNAFVGVANALGNLTAIQYVPSDHELYGVDPANDSVIPFDPTTMREAGPAIPVGQDPSAIAFDPQTDLLFVANRASNNVTVIDAATNQVYVSGITVGSSPLALVDATGDHEVFVANGNSSWLSVINAASPTGVPDVIPLTADPTSLAYSTAENLVVSTLSSGSQLAIINVTALAVQLSFTPVGVGASSAVSIGQGYDVAVLNTSGLGVELVNLTFANPSVNSTTSLQSRTTWLAATSSANLTFAWSQTSRTIASLNLPSNSTRANSPDLGAALSSVALAKGGETGWYSSAGSNFVGILNYTAGATDPDWVNAGQPVQTMEFDSTSDLLYVGTRGAVLSVSATTGVVSDRDASLSGNNSNILTGDDGIVWDTNSQEGVLGLDASSLAVELRLNNTTSVGDGVTSVALDPALNQVYVANSTASTITIYNASSGGRLGNSINVPNGASALLFDPVNQLVYAAGSNLSLIDPTDASIVGTIPFPADMVPVGSTWDSSREDVVVTLDSTNNSTPGELFVVSGGSPPTESGAETIVPLGLDPGPASFGHSNSSVAAASGVMLVPDRDSGTVSVVAAPPEIETFTASPLTTDVGSTIVFSTDSIGGAAPDSLGFQGLPPGCVGSASGTFSCQAENVGRFNVTAVLTDSLGRMATADVQLVVDDQLGVTVSSTPENQSEFDIDQPISFSASADGGTAPFEFSWNFSDGGSATGPSVEHSFSTAGSHLVTASVRDATGQVSSSSLVVLVAAYPMVAIRVGGVGSTDVGVPLGMSASVSGGISPGVGAWTFGDNTTSTGLAVSHVWNRSGAYEVHFAYVDAGGLVANATASVLVNPALGATVAISPDANGTGFLFASNISGGTPPFTVEWEFGDGSFGFGTPASHAYAEPGLYNVSVNVTDAAGVSVATSTLVVVSAPSGGSGTGSTPYAALILGLLVGATVAALVMFVAGSGRRRPPSHPPSPYVPPTGPR